VDVVCEAWDESPVADCNEEFFCLVKGKDILDQLRDYSI
jgi:hypothetical protein